MSGTTGGYAVWQTTAGQDTRHGKRRPHHATTMMKPSLKTCGQTTQICDVSNIVSRTSGTR
eukprot:10816591-Lingulodinium_polyedra.AAC.1